jgi:tripartite-type tricarboxylate transporter receptor subunit TctC
MISRMPRSGRRVLMVLFLGLVSPDGALAQEYPTRPIRFVVASPAGGNADLLARTIANKSSERFGQRVVVDNRAGAAGIIATEIVARAAPDGYTILLASGGILTINPALYKRLSYDPLNDFSPVSLISSNPLLLLVNPKSPARTLSELIALAKSKPGALTYGSGGVGVNPHLAAEMFKRIAGIEMTHIPYKGQVAAAVGLLGNEIDLMWDNITPRIAQVRSGALRALALSDVRRSSALPQVPTFIELGWKDYEVYSWYSVVAPAGTPGAHVTKLNTEINRILKLPEVSEPLIKEGARPMGGTPQEFSAYMRYWSRRWSTVIEAAGLRED